jgi:hypothetical protein
MRVIAGIFVAVLMMAAVAAMQGAAPVSASAPATFYGTAGVTAGDSVELFVGSASCGTTTANALNEWSIVVQASASCLPTEGAQVSVKVNGQPASISPSAKWTSGGTPPDIANGYVLTVGTGGTQSPAGGTGTTPASGGALSGSIPKDGGYGLVVFTNGGTIGQLVTATGCPLASMALYAIIDGNFAAYVPGTSIAAVNEAFLSLFVGGNVPANTAFVGRCV